MLIAYRVFVVLVLLFIGVSTWFDTLHSAYMQAGMDYTLEDTREIRNKLSESLVTISCEEEPEAPSPIPWWGYDIDPKSSITPVI